MIWLMYWVLNDLLNELIFNLYSRQFNIQDILINIKKYINIIK